MATRVGELTKVPIEPVVTVTEMGHIAMRVKDVDASLRFYHQILGLPTERLDEFREGKVDLFVKTPRQPGARWG